MHIERLQQTGGTTSPLASHAINFNIANQFTTSVSSASSTTYLGQPVKKTSITLTGTAATGVPGATVVLEAFVFDLAAGVSASLTINGKAITVTKGSILMNVVLSQWQFCTSATCGGKVRVILLCLATPRLLHLLLFQLAPLYGQVPKFWTYGSVCCARA